jgi:hypothetical protein
MVIGIFVIHKEPTLNGILFVIHAGGTRNGDLGRVHRNHHKHKKFFGEAITGRRITFVFLEVKDRINRLKGKMSYVVTLCFQCI